MASSANPLLFATALLLSSINCTAGFQSSLFTGGLSSSTSSSHSSGTPTHLYSKILDEQLQPPLATRRQFYQSLSTAVLASFLTPYSLPTVVNADDLKLEQYTDNTYGFQLSTPSEWIKTTQTLSGRRNAVFFTQDSSIDGNIDTLMYIAYTPIRDDFTSLASFGSVDAVAQATILPKGEIAGVSDNSKMLSAVSKKNAYYFDYTTIPVVEVEPGSGSGSMTKQLKPLHFRTIFTLLPLKQGAGGTLVTITMQTSEEKYGELRGLFDQIIDSFEKV